MHRKEINKILNNPETSSEIKAQELARLKIHYLERLNQLGIPLYYHTIPREHLAAVITHGLLSKDF